MWQFLWDCHRSDGGGISRFQTLQRLAQFWAAVLSQPQPPGLGHPVAFFGPLHAVDLQLAGHHVNDPGLKQALGGEAVQVQGRDGAESALQAYDGQIPGVLVHLAGKRMPTAAHVERQDRGLDGAGDVEGRHLYCGNLQYIETARGNALVERVGKMSGHKSKGPTEVRPDMSLQRIAIFCTQRPSEEGLEPDAVAERESEWYFRSPGSQ